MSIQTVNPADFIRPDGSIDVTPENWPTRDEIQQVRNSKWLKRCLDMLHGDDEPD